MAQELLEWGTRRAVALYPLTTARPIHTVGIVGAGRTGTRITLLARQAGWKIVVLDTRIEALESLSHRLAANPIERGSTPQPPSTFPNRTEEAQSSWVRFDSEPSGCTPPVFLTQDPSTLQICDLVLECVKEDVRIKQQVLAEVERHLVRGAVLATNTSTIPIGRLAAALENPSRLCGIHFFMPIPLRPVVEIVRGPESGGVGMATAISFVRCLGLTPLVVEDGPGFLANRLLFFYLNEALQLVEEGYRPDQIDQQATEFGWAMGPFALMDEIGLDVVVAAAWKLAEVFEDRIVRSPLLVAMVKKGFLGQKTGLGFYRYELKSMEDSEDSPEGSVELQPNLELASLLPEALKSPLQSGGQYASERNRQEPIPTLRPERNPSQTIPMTSVSGADSTRAEPERTSDSPPLGGISDSPTGGGISNLSIKGGISNSLKGGGISDSPKGGGASDFPTGGGISDSPTGGGISGFPTGGGISDSPTGGDVFQDATCTDRLHLAMLVEAVQMIEQGQVHDPRQVDLAVVWGLGFPPWRGGLLAWADRVGLDRLLNRSAHWESSTFRNHLAYNRLWERAHTQKPFYPTSPESPKG